MLRGTGVLRFENELINKLQKANIDYKGSKPIIYPMVTFSSIKDGINLLTRENPRAKSIENLVSFLKRHEFKGIHLDFEGLPAEYSQDLGVYLKELKSKLSENEMKLTFAVFPQVEFSEDRLFHKMDVIAPNVDEIVLMTYDYKNTKTEAGCVSPPEWVKKNTQEVLKQFPAEKLWVGLAAYGYEWDSLQKKVSVVSAREGEALLNKYPYEKDKSSCIK
ncbi:MAG: glycosyl hydrolase family 18 protein, partial [Leptospiraceae bacterium]|nr:glycosyl hydrolase family 18 protein [Leptospiraceae bacterium]